MKNRINFKLFIVVTLLTAIPAASYAGGRNGRPVKKKSANATLPGVAKNRENWEKWTKIPFIGIDNKESAAYARGNKNIEEIQVERANEICRQMPGTRYKGAVEGTVWSQVDSSSGLLKFENGAFAEVKDIIRNGPKYVWNTDQGDVEITKEEYDKGRTRKPIPKAVSRILAPMPYWVIDQIECTDDKSEVAVYHPSDEYGDLIDGEDDRPVNKRGSRLARNSDDDNRRRSGKHVRFEKNKKNKKSKNKGKGKQKSVNLSKQSLKRLIQEIIEEMSEVSATPKVLHEEAEAKQPSVDELAAYALALVEKINNRIDSNKAPASESSTSPSASGVTASPALTTTAQGAN